MSRKPDFVVIGAQKAASTFVQFCLSDHPDIWMPHGETTYFEDPDYGLAPPDYFDRLFRGRPEKIVGIKRPQYIGRSEVPSRICRDLPDAKLIAVLRDPVDRVVSAYYHYIRGGFLPVADPEAGLTKLLDGDQALLSAYPRSWEVLEFGLYHKHLQNFGPFFERGRIHVLLQEEITGDPVRISADLYRFLQVDDSVLPKRTSSRPQAVIYNTRRLALLRRMALLTSRYNADKTRSYGAKNAIARGVQIGYSLFDAAVLARVWPSARPTLSPRLRARLADFYRSDVEGLSLLINRNLSHWLPC
ncbi:sulfotransferase family protein [Pararhodobacter sp.]|uniref:sulfotransferase family protein n=1 Tax=Pararhodobacter sp. TaxID=2127056 RepID=UPI002FDE81FC